MDLNQKVSVLIDRLTPRQVHEILSKTKNQPASSSNSGSKDPAEVLISLLKSIDGRISIEAASTRGKLDDLTDMVQQLQGRMSRIEFAVSRGTSSLPGGGMRLGEGSEAETSNVSDRDDVDLGQLDSDEEEVRARAGILADLKKTSNENAKSTKNKLVQIPRIPSLSTDEQSNSEEEVVSKKKSKKPHNDNHLESDSEATNKSLSLSLSAVKKKKKVAVKKEIIEENMEVETTLPLKSKSDTDEEEPNNTTGEAESNVSDIDEAELEKKKDGPSRSESPKPDDDAMSSNENHDNIALSSNENHDDIALSSNENHDDDIPQQNGTISEDEDSDFQPKRPTRKTKQKVPKVVVSSDDEVNEGSDKKIKIFSSSSSDELLSLSESDNSKKEAKKKKKKMKSELKKTSSDMSSTESNGLDSSKNEKKKKKRKRKKSSESDSSKDRGDKSKKRRRVKVVDSSSKSGASDSDVQIIPVAEHESPGKGRKNIRQILGKKDLEKTTRQAAKEEEERQRRLADKQKQFNDLGLAVQDFAGDKVDKLVLDIDKVTKKPVVVVDQSIVNKLKPHQAKGIQFMWDACYESIDKKGPGGGCILAHCMGLGKTLQTVAFLHTIMTHPRLSTRSALVICPLNTVGNWYHELKLWCKDCDTPLRLHKLWEIKPKDKYQPLADWKRLGGVGIMHYDCFRAYANLDEKKGKGSKKILQKYLDIVKESLLDPGPDIVICDEGHLLKNISSQTTKAVLKIRTQRRIVLTGTPLQNNLMEYHTMMHFVKPNLLGTRKEFSNRFVNPIVNGQHADSSEQDVKRMKRRAHVLHKLLNGCVQRLDYSVLTPYLPPKFEYAISINLSPKQTELYDYYLKNVTEYDASTGKLAGAKLFTDYQSLVKVWTHPILLTIRKQESDGSESEGSIKDFICDSTTDDDESGDNVEELDLEGQPIPKPQPSKRNTRQHKSDSGIEETLNDLGTAWYSKFFTNRTEMENLDLSGKLVVLFEILKTCEAIGDKVLVFSQYITTLNLIEDYLYEMDQKELKAQNGNTKIFPPPKSSSDGRWRANLEYFRIDGSTKTDDRKKNCDIFNKKTTSRAKLFLISTKAGGLGINLVGANRVVIFDASWNPSHDLQSIFRVFRFGQTKPCYVYRLLAKGTMEEKIYNRQVVKLSLSCRVVDEQQIERHFQFDEIRDMYKFNPVDLKDRPIPIVPKDRLLADLLISREDWIYSYLEHDSLLENKQEEELSEEERKAAWEDYNNENIDRVTQLPVNNAFLEKLRQVYPGSSEEDLRDMCQKTMDIYTVLLKNMTTLKQNPNLPEALRSQLHAQVNGHLLTLKNWYGDTVDWNENLNNQLLLQKQKRDAELQRQKMMTMNYQLFQQLQQQQQNYNPRRLTPNSLANFAQGLNISSIVNRPPGTPLGLLPNSYFPISNANYNPNVSRVPQKTPSYSINPKPTRIPPPRPPPEVIEVEVPPYHPSIFNPPRTSTMERDPLAD